MVWGEPANPNTHVGGSVGVHFVHPNLRPIARLPPQTLTRNPRRRCRGPGAGRIQDPRVERALRRRRVPRCNCGMRAHSVARTAPGFAASHW